MSAVTIKNAKIFLQLKSKSRSLAKINERRLQPLLVYGHGSLAKLSFAKIEAWLK